MNPTPPPDAPADTIADLSAARVVDDPRGRRVTRLAALPAAVALLACAAMTAAVLWRPVQPDVATLSARADAATAAEDFPTALLERQQLLALRPAEPERAVDLALVLDRMKRRNEAMRVLSTVAPEAGGGYAPAHLRQAEWLVESMVLGQADRAVAVPAARAHLNAALADPELRPQAEQLLAVIDGLR